MSEEYVSKFGGEDTDGILDYANSLKVQDSEGEPDTVQIFDTDGVPHKVSKTELLKKSTLALPSLEDISSFVAVNSDGNAIGLMTKEQVASVLAELMPVASNNVKGLVAGSSSNFANPQRIYGSTDEVLIGTSLVKGGYCSLLIDIEFYNGSNNTLYHVDAGKSEGNLTANKICGVLSNCTFRKDSSGKVYVNGVRDCMIAVVVLSDSDSFSF